jgi:hypothetical protein
MTSTNRRFTARTIVVAALLGASTTAQAQVPDTLVGAVDDEHTDIVAIALGENDEVIVASVAGGRGRVALLDAIGDVVLRVEHEHEIVDLVTDTDARRIAVLRADALALLEPSLATVWERPLSPPIDDGHLAIGDDGTIAIAIGTRIEAIDAEGRLTFSTATGLDEVTALAVTSDGLVVAGGVSTRCGDHAALVAFDGHSDVRWDAWSSRDCDATPPVARVTDVRIGADGEIYVLGDADGPAPDHARVAWFARVSTDGTMVATGSFGFAAPYSSVRADAIAADVDGNVLLLGAATHESDDGVIVESPRGATGFYRMVAADLTTHRVSREFEIDDMDGARTQLVADARRAVAMIPAVDDDPARIVLLPTAPDVHKKEKTPDRDDVGTFGYESGASGIDPTCYCDARRTTSPSWWAATVALIALSRRRRA